MTELLKQCGWCGESLDENCNMVAKNREGIGLVISHGICPKCEDKYFPEEAYADTLRSEELPFDLADKPQAEKPKE